MIPQNLNYHESMFGSILRNDLPTLIHAARRKFIDFVDRSFLLHSGCTINSLQLSLSWNAYKKYGYRQKIDSWVHFALATNIKELSVDFSNRQLLGPSEFSQIYETPNVCFAPKVLKTLILTLCKFQPSSFQVFRSLQSISLVLVRIFNGTLAELVSICPVLQDESLENCTIADNFFQSQEDIMIKALSIINNEAYEWPLYDINLSPPCLLKLTIIRPILTRSRIRNATELLEVYAANKEPLANTLQGEALGSFLTDLNHCQSLILSTWFIQVLPTSIRQLPTAFNYLKHLHLSIDLVKQELPGISCLLQMFPNLENLALQMQKPIDVSWVVFREDVQDIFNLEEQTYWETQNMLINCLHFSLKIVTIKGFIGGTNELQMIKYLLRTARNLDRMDVFSFAVTLMQACNSQQLDSLLSIQRNILLMLSDFLRASPQALIAVT